MTRQNVTDGPREIMTRKCPTCSGDGVVLSETTAAIDVERRLRALAAGSKAKAFKVELNTRVASLLIGPGARRLAELEELTKRRFFVETREDVHLDHVGVLEQGTVDKLTPPAPIAEDADVQLELVEVGLHDVGAGIGKVDGYSVEVADAAKLVGKKVKAKVNRVLDGTAYATLVRPAPPAEAETPITAEAEAEKPTRAPRRKKAAEQAQPKAEAAVVEVVAEEGDTAVEEVVAAESGGEGEQPKPKKKTRRGSRGGRGRKKKTAATTQAEAAAAPEPVSEAAPEPELAAVATIHVPEPDLGQPEPVEAASGEEAEAEAPKPRKKTRRGTRGGRNRRRRPAGSAAQATEPPTSAESG
jgi:ribonuclease G